MGRKKTKNELSNVGVCVAADVLEYLGALEIAYGCSRSFLINAIIRDHAERHRGNSGGRSRGSDRNLFDQASPSLAKVIQM